MIFDAENFSIISCCMYHIHIMYMKLTNKQIFCKFDVYVAQLLYF